MPQLLILLLCFFFFSFFFFLLTPYVKMGVTGLQETRMVDKRSPVPQKTVPDTPPHTHPAQTRSPNSCFLAPELSGSSGLSFCHRQLQVCIRLSLWALSAQRGRLGLLLPSPQHMQCPFLGITSIVIIFLSIILVSCFLCYGK